MRHLDDVPARHCRNKIIDPHHPGFGLYATDALIGRLDRVHPEGTIYRFREILHYGRNPGKVGDGGRLN